MSKQNYEQGPVYSDDNEAFLRIAFKQTLPIEPHPDDKIVFIDRTDPDNMKSYRVFGIHPYGAILELCLDTAQEPLPRYYLAIASLLFAEEAPPELTQSQVDSLAEQMSSLHEISQNAPKTLNYRDGAVMGLVAPGLRTDTQALLAPLVRVPFESSLSSSEGLKIDNTVIKAGDTEPTRVTGRFMKLGDPFVTLPVVSYVAA